jgi:hypothetical protein
MRKLGFMVLSCLMVVAVWSFSATVVSAQTVKIPYVISMDGWWTGIAITNESDDPIDDMLMFFTTDEGESCSSNFKLQTREEVQGEKTIEVCFPYSRKLDEIAPGAILVNTIEGLYDGKLPSKMGSVELSSSNGGPFSVTVYIGSPSGFAYQVFYSK